LGEFKTGNAFGTVLALGSALVFSGIIECRMGEKLSTRGCRYNLIIIGCNLLFAREFSVSVNVLG